MSTGLAFWNGGNPIPIKSGVKVTLDDGTVLFNVTEADPANDIYNLVFTGDDAPTKYEISINAPSLSSPDIFMARTTSLRDLDQVQSIKRAEIRAFGESVLYGGMIHSGDDFATDAEATNISDTVMNGAGVPGGFGIEALDDTFVSMIQGEFDAYASALGGHYAQTLAVHASHIAVMLALGTAQEVVDYDYSAGWPANPVET